MQLHRFKTSEYDGSCILNTKMSTLDIDQYWEHGK